MDDGIGSFELSRNKLVDGVGEDAIVNGSFVRKGSGGATKQKRSLKLNKHKTMKSIDSQGFHQLLDSLAHCHELQGAALEHVKDENGMLRAQLKECKERLRRQSTAGFTTTATEGADWEARSQKTAKSSQTPSPQPPEAIVPPHPQEAEKDICVKGQFLGVLPGHIHEGVLPRHVHESEISETDFGFEQSVLSKTSEITESTGRNKLSNPATQEWTAVEAFDDQEAPQSAHEVKPLKEAEDNKRPRLAFDLEEAMQEIEDVDALEGEDLAPHGKGRAHFFQMQRTLTEDLYTFTIYKQWELEASRLQRQLSRNRSNVSWGQYKNSTHLLGQREAWVQRFVILPSSPRRVVWDICGMVLLAYDVVFIPLNALQPGDYKFFDVMDWITLLFWTIDMMTSCFTGYVDKGITVTKPKQILRHYIRGWFLLDLCVVVPDWVFTIIELMSGDSNDSGNLGKFLRVLRAARTVRLLRVAKLKHVMTLIRDRIDSEYMFIVSNVQKMMLLLLLVNHLIGCGWYWIGHLSQENGMKSWTQAYQHESFTDRYFLSLHWSLSQFTPGSMDVQPLNASERIYAVCCLISGLVMMSWFISSITASMAQMRSLRGEQPRQIWLLRRFLRQNQVSAHLTFRIQRYMEYACSQSESLVSESKITIIHLLSDQLLDELHYTVKYACLRWHPLLEWAVSFSPKTMYRLCRRTLSKTSLAPNDVLFQNGKACGNMFFLTQGSVRYVRGEEQVFEQVDQDDWLCEPAVWARWVHVGEARAVKESDLVQISVASFGKDILQDVPIHTKLSEYARLYVRWLNGEPLDELSDVSVGYEQRPIVSGFIEKMSESDKLARRTSVVVQTPVGGGAVGAVKARLSSLPLSMFSLYQNNKNGPK